MQHPDIKRFMQRIKQYYDEDLIYNMRWHTDCHVYDAVREEFEKENIHSHNQTPGDVRGHFNETFLGYITHYKGDEKSNRNRHYLEAMRRKRQNVRSRL
jgi:hypothetical protein